MYNNRFRRCKSWNLTQKWRSRTGKRQTKRKQSSKRKSNSKVKLQHRPLEAKSPRRTCKCPMWLSLEAQGRPTRRRHNRRRRQLLPRIGQIRISSRSLRLPRSPRSLKHRKLAGRKRRAKSILRWTRTATGTPAKTSRSRSPSQF